MTTFKLALSLFAVVWLSLCGSDVWAQRVLSNWSPDRVTPIVSGKAVTVESFDSQGGTSQAPDPLSQTLASLLGAPLADAIQQERNRVYPHAHPMPQAIRAQLTPFFPPAVLQTVRYSTDWDTTAAGTLPSVLLGNGVHAVTLGDVILFRDVQLAADPLLWAHELAHVEQYRRLGVETFATQYLQQAWVLEDEAITKANAIKRRLAR
jgi:uncharacterized protein DUF4157